MLVYILSTNNFELPESVIIWVVLNIVMYFFVYQSYNYILYDKTKLIIKNQLNPLIEKSYTLNDIVGMKIIGGSFSTVLYLKLKGGNKAKIIISNLRVSDVENMVKALSE
jgi:hypothetical protein